MNLKYEKFFKNYAFHNIIGHPLMQILNWVGKPDLANKIHDQTLPKEGVAETNTANTEDDVPEVNRIILKD